MAEYLPKFLGEELTCHICTEIYTDPVQLPCQHSFCRECLKIYVGSDTATGDSRDDNVPMEKLTTDSNTSVTPTEVVIYCPICRKVVDLDRDGVSKLPGHFTIANIVEKYKTEAYKYDVRSTKSMKDGDAPKCSLCEGDQPNTAAKGCVSCKCLYCRECLIAFHPMRGPLSKHVLVDAEQYAVIPVCEEHDEPLKVFCSDCRHLCCLACSVQHHAKHDIKTAEAAHGGEKEKMSAKTSLLKKAYDEISTCILELSKREEDVKQCSDQDSQTIETMYQNVQAALDSWKSEFLVVLEERRDSLLHQMKRKMEKLQLQSKNIESYLEGKQEYFENNDAIQYLMISDETIQSVISRIEGTESLLQSYKSCERDFRKSQEDQPLPKEEIYLARKHEDGSVVCGMKDGSLVFRKEEGSLEYKIGFRLFRQFLQAIKNYPSPIF